MSTLTGGRGRRKQTGHSTRARRLDCSMVTVQKKTNGGKIIDFVRNEKAIITTKSRWLKLSRSTSNGF